MKSSVPFWISLSFLLVHGSAQAQQIYMCKDENGRTITADRPISECIGRTITEFDKKGIARREIPPPPTAEQKRQIELLEQKHKAEQIAETEQKHRAEEIAETEQKHGAEEIAVTEQKHRTGGIVLKERKQSDRALRLPYRSEDDIETARKMSIEPVQKVLKRDLSLLSETEKQKRAAQIEADAYKKKNAAIPARLQRKIRQSVETIGGLKKVIQEREAELAEINAEYDESLKRYRRSNGVAAVR